MRRAMTVACAALAMVAAAGCGSKKAPGQTGADSASSSSGAPVQNATFTYLDSNELMVGWDPSTSFSNEVSVMNNMYEQLLRYDNTTQKVEPLLAESYESSEDGKTWTFKLRQGVKFHTGRAMDATAAKEAIERTIDLKEGAAYIWDPVKSITATDASTLEFKLKYAAPLDRIAAAAYGGYIFDTKAAPSKLDDWFAEGNEAGTGPYQLEQWDKGADVEVRLKQFEDYWGGWDDAHYARLVFRHVPQATTAVQLLRSGDATFARALNAQLFDSVKSADGMSSSTTGSFENLIGFLNTRSGPLKDQRIRKAVIAAMDYDGAIAALKGAGVEAHGLIPEGLVGYDASITHKQDTAQATQLLEEAGYGPGGKKLSLTLTHAQGDDFEALVASILKSNLADLNIDLKVDALQWTAQWDRAKSSNESKRQDIFVMYWYPEYADAYSWFTNLVRSSDEPYFNLSYLKDDAVDQQIDALQEQAAKGDDTAKQAYSAAQQAALATDAFMPFFVKSYQRAFRSSLTGYVDNPAYPNVVFAYDTVPGSAD